MPAAMTEALSSTCLEHLGLRFLCISLLRCCSTCGKNPQLWKNPKSWEAALETRTHPNAVPQLAPLDPPFVVASESKKLQVQSGRKRRRSTTRIYGWTYSRYFGTRLLYIHRQFLGIGQQKNSFFADEKLVQNFGSRMAELRRDPLVQRWVIISEKRGKRPSDFKRTPSTKEKEDIKEGPCAFCPGFEEGTGPETFAVREGGEPNASDWRVRVIVNKFPAVSQDVACGSAVGEGTVFGECRLPAFGSHEVVIETPNHDTPFVDLPVFHICDDHDVVGEEREKLKSLLDTHWQQQRSPKKGSKLIHAQQVLKAYQARMKYFRTDPRFKFCQVFKNRGNRAGASMTHSHSQILALPIITHNTEDELRGAKEYYDTHGEHCIFCDIVAHETVSKIRIIDENEQFITLSPYAPRFPYEVWLIPKRHSSNYESVDEDELQSMAAILKLMLKMMDVAFSQPPFNYVIQTAPLDAENWDLPYYHWYLRLVPHLVTLGGFELGSGCYINPVGPEKAAEFLRSIKLS